MIYNKFSKIPSTIQQELECIQVTDIYIAHKQNRSGKLFI